jgi:hypothetical protein
MTVELVVDAKAQLGECALWCERSQSLSGPTSKAAP